jgi:alpha-1,6-mannosyltransferase
VRTMALAGCGVALVGWALTALIQAPGENIPRYVTLMTLGWAIWLIAIRVILVAAPTQARRDLWLILAIGLVIRLLLSLTPPSLSDDVYRAVWDARQLHAGVNPYQYAPAAPEIAALRDDHIWPRVNHQHQHTPYPPLAEVLGALAYLVMPERLQAMQLLFGGLDLGAAALLAALLHRLGQDPRRCVVLAWSPLSAIHFAHSAHNDSAMVAAFVAAGLFVTFQRHVLAMVMLGAATLVKGVPLLTVPAFARATGWKAVAGWVVCCVLVTMPFLGAGTGLVAGVASEGGGQQFNDSLHFLLERAAETLVSSEFAVRLGSLATALATLAAAVGAGLYAGRDARGALVAGSWVWAVYLLTAPIVQPWYLSWLMPLTALTVQPGSGWWPFRLNSATAWLWWSGTVSLTELSYPTGGTSWWPIIRTIEYAPLYALLGAAAVSWWQSRRSERSG